MLNCIYGALHRYFRQIGAGNMEQARENVRVQLMEKAAEFFAKNGYAATKLADIAKETGVSRGPLYYYFADKSALYIETTRHTIEKQKASFAQIFDSGKPVEEIMREEFDLCLRINGQFFYKEANVEGVPDVSGMVKEYTDWLIARKRHLFEGARARGELRPDCNIAEMISMIYVFFYGITSVRDLARTSDGFDSYMLEHTTDYYMQMMKERFLAR